jgi:hypothetical protein
MKKLLFFASVLLMSVVFFGCEKEILIAEVEKDTSNETAKFTIKDNTLSFATYDDFNITLDEIGMKSKDEINYWFSEQGFVNLESKYYELYDEINTFTEEAEVRNFVKNNPKYLSIGNNFNGEEVKSTTEGFYNLIANENFEFILEGEIVDIRTIFQEDASSQRSCGNIMELDYQTNTPGCKNDRLARLKTKGLSDVLTYQGPLTIEHGVFLRGQKKVGCIWVNYQTGLDIIGTPTIHSTYNGTTYTNTEIPLTTGSTSCSNCYSIEIYGQTTTSNVGGGINVIKALAEGTTIGIGANSVIIDCD